jgi:tRNA A37 threonylcarbamoyladenosine dehydratase
MEAPRSSGAQLALGAALGAAAGAAATYYYCRRARGSAASSQPPIGGGRAAAAAAAAAVPLPFSSSAAATAPAPPPSTATPTTRATTTTITVRDHHDTDDILREQLSRNRQFFAATDGQERLARSFVVVVGLGGVGSHAAHMLLRAGVGRLRLVDFDQVSLSSLSRHATATRADVGLPKTEALARRLREILPEARVETVNEMFTADGQAGGPPPSPSSAEDRILSGAPDFVLDCIDNIHTKVDLIAACRARGVEVLCCAGAGAKADPTRLRFADLSESAYDPLARAVRKRLRRAHGFGEGVTVLLSTEAPRCALVAPCEAEGEGGGAEGAAALARAAAEAARASAAAERRGGGGASASSPPSEPADAAVAVASPPPSSPPAAAKAAATNPLADYQLIPNFRVRIVPVLGTTPAVFGQAAAAHVLCRLAGAPFDGEPLALLTAPQYQRACDRLAARERRRFGSEEGVAVDRDDVVYLLRELWRGYSARLGERGRVAAAVGGTRGLMRSTAGLEFTRWDASRPATLDNLVLLTAEEADAHDRLFSDGLGGEGGGEGQDEGQQQRQQQQKEEVQGGERRAAPSAGAARRALAALAAREPAFCAHVEAMLERARRDHWRVQLA